jgi:drug/metabolite transporter (DMT)-like permease
MYYLMYTCHHNKNLQHIGFLYIAKYKNSTAAEPLDYLHTMADETASVTDILGIMWTPSRIGELQILVGTILFGTCSVLMKYSLETFGFNPFVLNGMRSLFSATMLSLGSSKLKEIFRDDGTSKREQFEILSYCGFLKALPALYHHQVEKYVWIFLNGITGWCGTSFFIISISTVGASKAAFLLGLYIIFVPVLEIALYYPNTHRVTPQTLLGVVLAFTGTYLLCGCGWDCASGLHWGDMCGILGALGWASNIIIQNMALKRNYSVVDLSQSSVVISCVLSLCVGVSVDLSFFKPYGFPVGMTASAWFVVATIGIFEGIGYFLQALGFRYAEPTKASVLSGLETITTLAVSHLFLGEQLATLEYWGCFILVIGSLVVIAPHSTLPTYPGGIECQHVKLATDDPDSESGVEVP